MSYFNTFSVNQSANATANVSAAAASACFPYAKNFFCIAMDTAICAVSFFISVALMVGAIGLIGVSIIILVAVLIMIGLLGAKKICPRKTYRVS